MTGDRVTGIGGAGHEGVGRILADGPATGGAGARAAEADPRPHLVAVNRFYWPDHSATSQLLTDLCEHAAANGFRVTVVASRMRYDAPDARLAPRETRNGVEIRRVATTRLGRERLGGRAVDYLGFYLSAFGAMLAVTRRGDVLLAKTDPPLVSVPAAVAAWIRGAHLVNWLQDVFPEVAGALGLRWAAGPAGRLLRSVRNASLRAGTSVAISEAMAERVRAEVDSARARAGLTGAGARAGTKGARTRAGVKGARLCVIPNWPDAGIRPVPRVENRLRAEWGLSERFVIGYSGNLGRAHAADAVAGLVRRTARLERVSWLFVGGGSGLGTVRRAAAEVGADIRFLPYQPRALLAQSLSAADLHLVSLDPSCEGLIMPSKLVAVLAAGRGVLALGDPEGGLGREVRQAGLGVALDLSDPDAWAPAVASVATFARADGIGKRCRQWYEAHYRTEATLEAWLDTIRQAGSPARVPPVPRVAPTPAER